MLAFLALVVAVIALVVASNARRETRELRAIVHRWSGGLQPAEKTIEPVAPPPPVDTGGLKPAAPLETPPPPPVDTGGLKPAAPQVTRTWNIDWENLIGIKLFSRIGAIAFVLALVFLFRYSVEHGWLRPAVRAAFGFLFGIGLLVVCELKVARNYKFTANAMLGAGIAILYATLFALYGRWHLWPAPAAFFGMLVVTAAAVFLSTRRDSVFIALLGLLGGFATPALLSSGENRPIALFSYLLLLNGGIAWIAYRKGWPLLTALSVALTAFYQWTWVERFLDASQLPLAAVIFAAFAIVAGASLVSDKGAAFRRIAGAGAVLPLLFAFFTAIVPEYGARYNVLFGFLLLIAAGLAAISLWRGAAWLHSLGGAATLVTFFIWLTVSYTHESWPWSLAWLAVFVALYLAVGVRLHTAAVYAAPLLFFVFIGLAVREPQQFLTLAGAMFALLAVVVVAKPHVAPIAIALSSIAMMTMQDAPAWLNVGAQAVLFATLFVLAWISERHWLAPAAIPLFIVASYWQETHAQQLTAAAILYALFLLYPASLGRRIRDSVLPHLAASMAGIFFFVLAYVLRDDLGYAEFIGAVPLAQALAMLALAAQLLRYEPMPPRLELVLLTALAFLTAIAPVQLEGEWISIAWAIEAAALAWLYTRVPHRGVLFWIAGLGVGLLPMLRDAEIPYVVCAVAMFVVARLAPMIRILAASLGTIELFVLLNVAIDNFYDRRVAASPLAQGLTYTIAWALFAIAMLVAGIALRSRGARVAALGLLLVTVLKCFLYDLASLGGLYRVGSLFGLAVSLVLVGLMLQKFVMMRRVTSD